MQATRRAGKNVPARTAAGRPDPSALRWSVLGHGWLVGQPLPREPRRAERRPSGRHKPEDIVAKLRAERTGSRARAGTWPTRCARSAWLTSRSASRSWRRRPGEATKPRTPTRLCRASSWLRRSRRGSGPWARRPLASPRALLGRTATRESLNARTGDERLNGGILRGLRGAAIILEGWRRYGTVRPQASLGCRPPAPEALLPTSATRPAAPPQPAPPASQPGSQRCHDQRRHRRPSQIIQRAGQGRSCLACAPPPVNAGRHCDEPAGPRAPLPTPARAPCGRSRRPQPSSCLVAAQAHVLPEHGASRDRGRHVERRADGNGDGAQRRGSNVRHVVQPGGMGIEAAVPGPHDGLHGRALEA